MHDQSWQITNFTKQESPIIGPDSSLQFTCPISKKVVRWAEKDCFNPAAGVKNGQVYLLVRAEDAVGRFKGTSRIGLAVSTDGIHFTVRPDPVIFPANDEFLAYERDGGCEDPRLVLREDGTWICTYSAFNGHECRLMIATSRDLLIWSKHGPAFAHTTWAHQWSKSGAIVSRWNGDQLVMTRIGGRYWMYWGEGVLFAATSDDGIAWTPVEFRANHNRSLSLRADGTYTCLELPGAIQALHPLMHPRPGRFDTHLVEPGPAAVLGDHGIVLWYNGACPGPDAGIYSGGQALFDGDNPTEVINRPATATIVPDRSWELNGQSAAVTFTEGLVRFRGKHLLYYGCADSKIGLATA